MENQKVAVRNIAMTIDYYILIEELKTDGLYWLETRNAHVGIWFNQTKGFVIPREKFVRQYLFVEYHWDTNDEKFPYGTAKPFELIEIVPFNINEFFDYKKTYIGFGWSISNETNRQMELLDYLLKKSEEFSEENFLKRFSKMR